MLNVKLHVQWHLYLQYSTKTSLHLFACVSHSRDVDFHRELFSCFPTVCCTPKTHRLPIMCSSIVYHRLSSNRYWFQLVVRPGPIGCTMGAQATEHPQDGVLWFKLSVYMCLMAMPLFTALKCTRSGAFLVWELLLVLHCCYVINCFKGWALMLQALACHIYCWLFDVMIKCVRCGNIVVYRCSTVRWSGICNDFALPCIS